MLNLLGLIIVLMLIIGLRQQGFSFAPGEHALQRCGIWGRGLIAMVLAYGAVDANWGLGGLTYIFNPLKWPAFVVSLLQIALYWIHEAGHGLLNLVIHGIAVSNVLAGTLFQLLVPLGFAFYLLIRRGYLATAMLMVYVFGLSLQMTAPYIGDARARKLPIPEGIHDWTYLLDRFGLLESDKALQNAFTISGWTVIAISLLTFALFSGTSERDSA